MLAFISLSRSRILLLVKRATKAIKRVINEKETHISIGILKKMVRNSVPTNGENVPMIPEIAELNTKYSPLLSTGAILEIVTEKKGLVRD